MGQTMYIPPFSIEEVSDLLGIERIGPTSGASFGVVCPFCGDRRGKMNFCICKDGQVKNTYHCFHCGESGNMLQLYAKLRGLYGTDACKVAYREIRNRLLDVHSSNGNGWDPGQTKIREFTEQSALPVDFAHRDAVYRELLSMLRLSKKHRRDLQNRGLNGEQVSRMGEMGFLSTAPKENKSLARRLIKKGYSLEGVPGFYMDDRGEWMISFYQYNSGILCPVYSENAMIAGFQIRMDEPFKGMKYTWLTSAGKRKGCSSKSPAGFFGSPDADAVYVTEGILKAAVAHLVTGKPFIGNPGVGHYKELKEMLARLKARGVKLVFECYDMDKDMRTDCREDCGEACVSCERYQTRPGANGTNAYTCPKKQKKRDDIRAGCGRLYQTCEELQLKCVRVTWEQDADGYWSGKRKGIDDWQLGILQEQLKQREKQQNADETRKIVINDYGAYKTDQKTGDQIRKLIQAVPKGSYCGSLFVWPEAFFKTKKGGMALMKKSGKVAVAVSIACILAGVFLALQTYLGYIKGREGYQNLADTYTSERADSNADAAADDLDGDGEEAEHPDSDSFDTSTLPEDAPERITIDWESFLKTYPDCVGWIHLPAVELSYPVMQSSDNDYYLHRSPEGGYLYAGSIFMDYQCSPDFSDLNTIIYGHNMRDGSMFAKLKQYNDAEVFLSCPYFWIYTPDGDYLYRIYSVHKAEVGSGAFSLMLSDGEYRSWFLCMLEASEMETEVLAKTEEALAELLSDFYGGSSDAGLSDTDIPFGRTVTLSTCTGISDMRQLVQGCLVGIAD
ncbi:MAG: sortase [Lachnospiraceae bacterium]|nr:sortase [Lachnospiraceae bacterium]